MRARTAAALTAVALLPLTACFAGPATTAELSYQIDQSVTALVIGARAASVAIAVGDGPVTVTEEHRYSSGKPNTAHQVEGHTLRLTESGCGDDDDDARCDVGYTIRVPKAMSVEITAQAGAVKLDGLAGNLRVTTEAGAVEGHGLTSDQVIIHTEAGVLLLMRALAREGRAPSPQQSERPTSPPPPHGRTLRQDECASSSRDAQLLCQDAAAARTNPSPLLRS